VLWKPIQVRDRNSEDPDAKVSIPLLRSFTVFNLAQCDGVTLPPRMRVVREPVTPPEAMAEILAAYVDGPEIVHRPSTGAWYEPAADRITLPELSQFDDAPGYASTALHELVHSTGHESRLDRFAKTGPPQHFGTERYAAEELTAEIGASMLAAEFDIPVSFDRSAAYVASWLEALRNDSGMILAAAQRSHHAVDRIVPPEDSGEVNTDDNSEVVRSGQTDAGRMAV
jgi:antirestriction protein ArdC